MTVILKIEDLGILIEKLEKNGGDLVAAKEEIEMEQENACNTLP